MAECFAKVNEQEIQELLGNTTPKILCLYNETIIPFTLVVHELIANLALRTSLAMTLYTTRACGIMIKYIYIYIYKK